jgi:hypothetical protein
MKNMLNFFFESFVRKQCMVAIVFFQLLLAVGQNLQAQTVSAQLKADSNHLLIGDFLNVQLTVKHSAGVSVTLPTLTDSLGNMDLIGQSKTDTVTEGNNILLTKAFTVSAYDSGEFHAGPFMVLYMTNSGVVDTVFSNPVAVWVNTLNVDTSKPIKPIKAPLDVPYTWQEFTYYIIAGIALLVSLILGWLLWRKYRKNKPVVEERPKPKDPPHVWAKKELKKLEEEKLWQQDAVKQYYSRLTEILRLYLEYRYNWLALESTTEEIITEIGKYPVNDVAKNLLLEILQSADLVKFAKVLPAPDVNTKAMANAKDFIDVTAPVEGKTEEKK